LHSALLAGLSWLAAQTGPTEIPASGELAVPPSVDQSLDGAAAVPVRPGGYPGPAPGQDAKNPLAAPRNDPPRLVWTGFKMAGVQSEIFLQTTRPVLYELTQPSAGGRAGAPRLSVFLRNCRIHLKNNGRRLDTRFFATKVEEVSARQRRRDVEIIVELESPATPTMRTEPGPDGTHFLVLTFPAGQAVQAASAAPIDERAIEPPSVAAPASR
jgi:hypothetical protein